MDAEPYHRAGLALLLNLKNIQASEEFLWIAWMLAASGGFLGAFTWVLAFLVGIGLEQEVRFPRIRGFSFRRAAQLNLCCPDGKLLAAGGGPVAPAGMGTADGAYWEQRP